MPSTGPEPTTEDAGPRQEPSRCPHCKRPRAELSVMDKSGDPRLIRTWRRMASELDDDEHARFEALLEKRAGPEGLTPGESDALERLSFQQQLANTVQSYVLCQGCHSLEHPLFFSSRETIRAALKERGW